MRTTSRAIAAAERRAGDVPCRSCSAMVGTQEIDTGALFDRLMVLREQMIRKQTREQVLEQATRCENEAARLRSLAGTMPLEVVDA